MFFLPMLPIFFVPLLSGFSSGGSFPKPLAKEKEQQLLAHLKACGHRTDQIIADAEGRLVTVYREYLNYLVKESPEGRECDTRSESEILAIGSLFQQTFCPLSFLTNG